MTSPSKTRRDNIGTKSSSSSTSAVNRGSTDTSHHHGTRWWIERLLLFAILFLTSMGLFYSNKRVKLFESQTKSEQQDLRHRSSFKIQQRINEKRQASKRKEALAQYQNITKQMGEDRSLRSSSNSNRSRESPTSNVRGNHHSLIALLQKEHTMNIQQHAHQPPSSTAPAERDKDFDERTTSSENVSKSKGGGKEEQKTKEGGDGHDNNTNDSNNNENDDDRNKDEENEREDVNKSDNENASHKDTDDDGLNIVLFYADDWTMDVLGKLNPDVHTPNIDEMADNGIIFTNNCVTTSVCWISRATLMTGLYYSRHLQGKPHLDSMFTTHNWNLTLFPRLRRERSYYTGLVGKWHAPQPSEKMQAAFDSVVAYYGDHWLDWFSNKEPKEMEYVTELNRRHAIEFLRKRPLNQKFALKVSFFATHAWDGRFPSYQPTNSTRNSYYPDSPDHSNYTKMVPPKTATDKHWKELPWFFNDVNAGRLRWRNRWEPGDIWQKNIRDLYAMATEVDWAIGEIIQELKRQGVYNNTLLIFTTDNGDLHGEHGLSEKWYPYEESLKVPLVIQDPRMATAYHGTTNTEFTLNVDLAPTILGAAGLDPTYFMQGRDISELYLSRTSSRLPQKKEQQPKELSQQQERQRQRRLNKHPGSNNHTDISVPGPSLSLKPWRKDWFYEWNMGDPINASGHEQEHFIDATFALITEEWKYIYWPQKDFEQLFHRSKDPYDEYDILRNYYIFNEKESKQEFIIPEEREKIQGFNETVQTPVGDSIQSTTEIYHKLKARFYELKKHVQSGNRI